MSSFWTQLTKPIVALAPMAGVTDTAFRQLCKLHGADVIYTEFVSVDALVHENKKTRDLLAFAPTEQPVVAQIFGRKPELFHRAAGILAEMGFSGIDINFGCPAYKVVKSGGGVKLMRNLSLCHELTQAACEGSSLPISIKIRASIKRDKDTRDKIEGTETQLDGYESNLDVVSALDLVQKIKNLPIAAIMLHARSYEQPFDGEPDIAMLQEVRKIWLGVLLANGGVYSPEKAKELLQASGADGVGIARGAWGRPWIFNQIKQYLSRGSYRELSWAEITHVMLQHAQLALAHQGQYGLIELRKHLSWYAKGFAGAAQVRSQLVQIKTLDDVERILADSHPGGRIKKEGRT